MPSQLSSATLERLATELPGLCVEVVEQIDSTNSELMRRARQGATQPVLLLAHAQTAGRGRLGRAWVSAPDQALTFSLGLPLHRRDWSGLSLAVGLSVARSLHPDLRIKWPNDLWWQQRKLAGILIETANVGAQRYAVIGIGINLRRPQLPDQHVAVAGLEEFMPDGGALRVLEQVLWPLVQTIQAFERSGFVAMVADFNARDALHGLTVTLSDGRHGRASGVDERGALLVHTDEGVQVVTSAEVSVRVSRQDGV